ncbi:unnamed protein product [Spodoptera exigua]|nr:unnamed protein product [Spodoptera exigua]
MSTPAVVRIEKPFTTSDLNLGKFNFNFKATNVTVGRAANFSSVGAVSGRSCDQLIGSRSNMATIRNCSGDRPRSRCLIALTPQPQLNISLYPSVVVYWPVTLYARACFWSGGEIPLPAGRPALTVAGDRLLIPDAQGVASRSPTPGVSPAAADGAKKPTSHGSPPHNMSIVRGLNYISKRMYQDIVLEEIVYVTSETTDFGDL